jgi:hypothetical protein
LKRKNAAMIHEFQPYEVADDIDFFDVWGAATYRSRSRRPTKRIRLRATSIGQARKGLDLARCDVCGQIAVWDYGALGRDRRYCDVCVPRGCGCNVINNEDGSQDEYCDLLGRAIPCCEYDYYPGGFPARDRVEGEAG